MCEYCDAYVRVNDGDVKYIDQYTIGILDNAVELDGETYISSLKPELVFVKSLWVNNAGPYNEKVKRVPITYCPFCGADLEIERENREKQLNDKFEKSQKEFDEMFSWYPEGEKDESI